MGILDEFNPRRDGWSFQNWGEGPDFSWDLYRRTYLAINPTNDPVASPLDVAFFQIFKSCASKGNCGGMSMLALALFKYGGYMGFCSPPNVYAPANNTDHKQPGRADLHEAINIMQARQFSAAGIRNFLDVVKAGQLNDGVAAWNRIRSGLGSGDYCMLSLSNGVFGDAAHTIIPYRAEMSGGAYVLHVWNSNLPYAWYPGHYDGDHNKIVITGPTSWHYDQNVPTGISGDVYDGSNNGWFFAIPTSLEIHKGRQPISAGFVLTGVMTLFVSGVGAAVTQIEDDEGRRLYTSDRVHRDRNDLESSPARRLPGVAPWPWAGGLPGDPPGELFFLERPPGSSPLNVSVEGPGYRVMHLSSGHLTEVTAAHTESNARDRLRLEGSTHDDQSVVVQTGAPRRHFDVQHLRCDASGRWRSVKVRNALVNNDQHLGVHVPVAFDTIEISRAATDRDVDVELRRYDGRELAEHDLPRMRVLAGHALRMAPDWERVSRSTVETVLVENNAVAAAGKGRA